jgi:hypothetical protein
MRFERCQGWRFSFRDRNNPGARFRELTFANRGKLEDLVARTPTRLIQEDRQAFGLALRNGCGAVHLTLTAEQYGKLRR